MTTSSIHSNPSRESRPLRVVALTLAVLLALPGQAFATPRTPNEEAAVARFKSGQRAYNLGRFAEALQDYSDAYELRAAPELLFNIAQCHRQLTQWERAAFFYKRYLALSVKPPRNARLVQELISEVEQKQAEAERFRAEEQRRRDEEISAQRSREEDARGKVTPSLGLGHAALSVTTPGEPAAPLYKKWWFWTGVGAVVVGGAATAFALSAPRAPAAGSLGTLDGRTR